MIYVSLGSIVFTFIVLLPFLFAFHMFGLHLRLSSYLNNLFVCVFVFINLYFKPLHSIFKLVTFRNVCKFIFLKKD